MVKDRDASKRPLAFITESIRERAKALGREGRHDAAVVEYQVLVDVDPTDVGAGMALAFHLTEAGEHGRAAEELLRVAALYAHTGHARRAVTVALRALELEPGRVVQQRLGPLVSRLGPEAVALCEQIARVHLLSDRPESARDVLRLLVEAEPTEIERRLRLAEVELSLGRTEEALVGLRIVADGLRSHGRTAELTRVLEMMLAHGGNDEAVLRELASIYLRWGQPRRAQVKLEALGRVAPDDRMTVERLARVNALLGRQETTLRMLRRLVELIAEQADRMELHAALRRASSWSSDASYLRAIEQLGLSVLRPGGARSAPRARPRPARRRRATPPPLPRWSRTTERAQAAAGEIHVLDPDEDDDAELISEHAMLMPDGSVLLPAAE